MSNQPPHPAVLALGYSEASMLLRQDTGSDVKAIICIYGAREFPVEAPAINNKLVLRFDDAEVVNMTDPEEGYRAWIRSKWATEIGRPTTPPNVADAKAIIEFANAAAGIEGTVLCQCQGGISRSPAAALLCLATWTGERREQYCMNELLRIRPCAAPHRGLVLFGDHLLGRGGKLIRAVLEARRG